MNTGLSLLHPAVLWGTLAALLPVLIHFLLRPRPRRVSFPALALMQAEFASGQRADRLRNLLLLLMRVLLLICAVLLLSGPTCRARGQQETGTGPLACVIVLDDSLSMRYRLRYDDATTLLDRAQRCATALLDELAREPPGSQFAVLLAGGKTSGVALTTSPDALRAVLRDSDGLHAQPLGRVLREAARLLRSVEQASRRLVVLTDATASAWRDVSPAILSGVDNLSVRVLAPPPSKPANLGIVAAASPPHICPTGAQTAISLTLRAEGIGTECWIAAKQHDQLVARVGPVRVTEDGREQLALRLPPRPSGSHGVTLELEPDDLLPFDQRWFVSWQTGPPPLVWLVQASRPESATDTAALLVRNLLAPDALARDEQRVALEPLSPVEMVAALAPDALRVSPALVVVFPDVSLPATAADALRRVIDAGATVLLVPDSTTADADWPGLRALLSDALPGAESLRAGVAIHAEPRGPLSPSVTAELARCMVYRRIRLEGLLDEATVIARYSDNVPAIVARRLGRGRLILLTTSPDPQWSELGVRAAGLLMWLHGLVHEAHGAPDAAAQFTAGQPTTQRFRVFPATDVVSVAPASAANAQPTWLRLREGTPQQPWPTEDVGLYVARSSMDRSRVATYAVNWPAEEFELRPISQDELAGVLGTGQLRFEQGWAEGALGAGARSAWSRGLLDPTQILAAVLLLLFFAEMVVATHGQRAMHRRQRAPG